MASFVLPKMPQMVIAAAALMLGTSGSVTSGSPFVAQPHPRSLSLISGDVDDSRIEVGEEEKAQGYATEGAPLCDPDLFYGADYIDVCHYGRGSEARPIVVLVHGAKSSKVQVLQSWGIELHKRGYIVASMAYDVPHCPENLLTATTWLRQNAVNFGGDPDRIGILGASWGGTCTSVASLTVPMPGVRGVVLVSTAVPIAESKLLRNTDLEVLLIHTNNEKFVSRTRMQEMLKILQRVGINARRYVYATDSPRVLNVGSDPLDKVAQFFDRVLGKA